MKISARHETEARRNHPYGPLLLLPCVFCLASFFLHARLAFPVPAWPGPAVVEQPDGTVFAARRVGDERRNFTETEEGYTIVQDAESGFWFYAVEENGVVAKSGHVVGKVSPKSLGLKKHLRSQARFEKGKVPSTPSAQFSLGALDEELAPVVARAPEPTQAVLGTVKALVILARFSGHTTYFTQSQFDNLMNQVGYTADGAAGSVKDYYLAVSGRQLTIDGTVSSWVGLPQNEFFYGAGGASGQDANPWRLVRDAAQALDQTGFDFRPFDVNRDGEIDMLVIVHSGLGQEYAANPSSTVWSQVVDLTPAESIDGVRISRAAIVPERRRDTTSITRIGILCHEMGHLLGLPDLYDEDYSSSGIGVWGLMGTGSWGGDGYSEQRPVHLCCWSKVRLGWITPTEIDESSSPVSVPAIENSGASGVFRVSCEMGDGEYLLIENRQKIGFDLNFPGAGLLVWHIDDNLPWNTDESHYKVGLLQADGNRDLEDGSNRGDSGDPFPGSSNKRRLDDSTSPNTASYYNGVTHIALSNISDSSNSMSFDLSTLIDAHSESFSAGLPGTWQVVDGGKDGYKWSDQNPRNRTDPNWSGKFMLVDSEAAAWRIMNEELISPEIDCSIYVNTRIEFSHSFAASGGQTGDVDVRVDGGAWQNIARYKFNDDAGTRNLAISSFADGRSSVQFRWRFYNISYGLYWGIDNVAVRGELSANSPPQITLNQISQRRDASGHIEIRFTGTDAENNPANWVTNDCEYSAAPYTTWQPLTFDTADGGHTADEPMPFTAQGKLLVAVVDASSWNGLYKVKLRVTGGITTNPAVTSNEFLVDNTAPTISAPTSLQTNPVSGSSLVTALSSWDDPSPGSTWFQLKVNDGAWGTAVRGAPTGAASQSATFGSLSLDGDDCVTVKSYHVDLFGNQSGESLSSPYYAIPLTPSMLSVGNATPNSLAAVVKPNASEKGNVDYAVYCSTGGRYVDSGTGRLTDLVTWAKYSAWGGATGKTVVGLKSKTAYSFQVMASNPGDHRSRSSLSSGVSGATTNSRPNAPSSVAISPEHPVASDNLVGTVTPGSPPDNDPEDAVSYKFTWSCPGKPDVVHGPKRDLTDSLPSLNTRKGETWSCKVEGYDLWQYGPAVSASVVIENTPPSRISSMSITPSSPKTTDDIVSTVTPATTPDADPADVVTYRYTWTCPGKGPAVHGPSNSLRDALSSDSTTKRDVWTCTVEPYDGDDYGPPLSRQVIVGNSPPSVEVLGQLGAYVGQSIELTIVGSDADADGITIACPTVPGGATFSQSGDNEATFSWPNPSLDVRQDVTFSASDGTQQTSRKVSLTFSQEPFVVASVGKSVEPGGKPQVVITWYALPGVSYSVRRSADLMSWQPVASGLSLPEEATEPGWLTYQETVGVSASLLYYRLVR